MSECFICVKNQALVLSGQSSFKSRATLSNVIKAKVVAKSSILPKPQQLAITKSKYSASSKIKTITTIKQNPKVSNTDLNGKIKGWLKVSGNAKSRNSSISELNNTYVDKFAGNFTDLLAIKDFACVQKLYPISDRVISLNNSYFVDKYYSSGNLYNNIDEGLFTGNYIEHLNKSNRISDDQTSYIQPSSIFTSGTFRYKCEVSRPYHHPEHSFIFIRASAPTSNYGANIPPEYRIHNIKLEDPSGNLIVKYKDIYLKGDADYSSSITNYSTYISEPEINNATLRSWDPNYPILNEASGYTLNLDFDVMCLDDPFTEGFSVGYEEKACDLKFVNTADNDYLSADGSPLSTHTQGYHLNPTNSIRISAIEIGNSGDLCSYCSVSGIRFETYFGIYTDVGSIGERLSRTLYPTQILTNSYDVDIYPETYSLWKSSQFYDEEDNVITADNTQPSGASILNRFINDLSDSNFITLYQSSPVSDSGRLTLKFNNKPQPAYNTLSGGAFNLSSSKEFDRANPTQINEVDNFFTIDSLELKIIAKKTIGSRDYVLDVVGYSDDKILNVTPKIGSFLQNTNVGFGNIPLASGFNEVNDLGISSESLSDKSQYYEEYLTQINAGDHYKLSTLPVVNSTEFAEYTIPLSIYQDVVDVGKSIDYSMSSYFENLFIDLYPIPSGASISSVRLMVKYKPANGIMLHTLGTPSTKNIANKDVRLLPIGWDGISLNSDVDDGPISIISGIPQGYSEPLTLKTNYSRRWRGVDGNIVNGPYDPNQFDFSFYNPEADHPFLNGYFNLNNTSGNWIISSDYSSSGYYNGSNSILQNIGWRYNSDQLFTKSTDYKTLDWAEPSNLFYGKLSDAFDSALALSSGKYIQFNNFIPSGGFCLFLRFTPNEQASTPNLALKWFTLAPPIIRPSINLYISNTKKLGCTVWDTITNTNKFYSSIKNIDEYQFPLSILLTYTGSPSGILRLYARDELNNSNDLCFETNPISIPNNNIYPLIIGDSFNLSKSIFVHEIGLSTSGNLIHENPNRLLKQTTAESFLDSHSHSFNELTHSRFKLHNYIDDDTSSWKLGDFKICAFSPDFDGFTTRIGKDYIVHNLKHHGSGYAQITDLSLPSSINASGLAYHTQIENDFLRFNLQNIPDANPEFYSTLPRICKTLPRGYDFTERALVVDTVLEHETNNDILWPDGSVGPKLIVSLYSKNQDPVDRPSKVNWGLINRSIHYLPPSGCYEKISSTFNYNDLIDISEPWALFDLDNVRSEFDHKLYSTDINDMFLQYDLVYPSGSPFESKIKIHSANVRLEDALVSWASSNNQFNLYSSGESISYAGVNLYSQGSDTYVNSLPLFSSGSYWPTINDSVTLYTSGVIGIPNSSFNLFVKNSGTLSEFGPDLYVLAGPTRDDQNMPLVMTDNTLDQTRLQSLDLFIKNTTSEYASNSLALSTPNAFSANEFIKSSNVNLITYNDQTIVYNTNNQFNLYINTDLGYSSLSGTFNLFTINYLAYNQNLNQQASISWNTSNLGTDINPIIDADVPYLEANDEIRGVDLLCYGDCEDSNLCKESPITLHDIDWYGDYQCLDGGIFRVKNTYTNLSVSGFKTPIGYSGHFYGIRKYEGLIPNAPYDITIATKTGSQESIKLPTQFVELDYGSNENVDYSGVLLTANKNLTLSEISTNNKYGKAVAARKDLIAVGSPMQTISYSEYDSSGNLITTDLEEAGSVYLYRRSPQPSGYTWTSGDKGDWVLEEKITLPSGLLKDYPTLIKTNIIGNQTVPLTVTQRYWNIGQEGRQFGHSLDLAVNENISSFGANKKEVLVVGGPSAKWNRDFEDLNVSGVSIGLLIFTDEFRELFVDSTNPRSPIVLNYQTVLNSIQNKDLIFRYFSDPPIKFDIKLIICEPIADSTNTINTDFSEPKPNFIVKKRIPRNVGIVDENDTLAIFSGIKSAFDEAFPYDTNKLHNNIPVMLGVYVDNSRSLGRRAVAPGLDSFLSYYQEYSFVSGVRDFFNVQSSGAVYEYSTSAAGSENWISLAITALNELLDTGRLVQENQVRFLTSSVGTEAFNINLSEFNYPPTSGGRVYIFEKESGNWNLIQEIKSPNDSYDIPDRFGHAVAISKDTNIISIGSPYINDCCKILQHKPSEKNRLYSGLLSWLNYKNSIEGGNSIRFLQLIEDHNSWTEIYGSSYANEILYSKLTSTEKFQARQYLNINEYENIFTYSMNNIPYVGNGWGLIPEKFAPTSRLGYSTAVNEDGSIVAFGAPTDSFNIFEDYNVYYKNDGYEDPLNINNLNGNIKPSWKSNVNAGAVRLFESRSYYPHDSVVEYGKFGNLQESIGNPLDSGHFNYLANIFADKSFRKMTEGEVSIPQDAGLAFIITPGIDALSEEIIENLIQWLSLGDRNLVLVGNDPVWEENGLYANSNNIINRILEALNSKMRITAARNIYESLPSGNSTVIPSFRPQGGTQTYISPFDLTTASGVGDIRMHFPGYYKTMPCAFSNIDGDKVLTSINTKCELPLSHNGDLRAQWLEDCISPKCEDQKITYPVNWPYIFKNFEPSCCPISIYTQVEGRYDLPNQDPVPILVASEKTLKTRILPAIPEKYQTFPIYQINTTTTFTTVYDFDLTNISPSASFIWNSGYIGFSSYETNINNSKGSTWFNPPAFLNTSGILQAKGYSVSQPVLSTELVADVGAYCVEQSIGSSKIIAIAHVNSESQDVLYKSGTSDNNIDFYVNLVSKNANGGSNIAQLGGWTGRTSFKDAFNNSILEEIFKNTGNEVYLNIDSLSSIYDVCWIANPANLPSENDIINLQTWLALGNKKLIITHDSSISQVLKCNEILSLLNTNISPLFLPVKDQYHQVNYARSLSFNTSHPVSIGFNKYSITQLDLGLNPTTFIPFSKNENIVNICFDDKPIYDDKIITDTYFRVYPGVEKITFPVVAGSGYKLFIDYVSDSESENQPIDIYLNNISIQPALPYPNNISFTTPIPDLDNSIVNNPEFKIIAQNRLQLNSTPVGKPKTISTNIQVLEDKNTIEVFIHSMNERNTSNFIPKTPKILSISGVAIPVVSSVLSKNNSYTVITGWETRKVAEAIPETIITEFINGPIMTLNDKYCNEDCAELGLGNQFIADGPVVTAQEIESVSSFNVGVARSRITVIADSNLVQGRFMADEFGRIPANTVAFIRSLYPNTVFPSTNAGRQYNEFTKIVSPERGSPQKYYALKSNIGSIYRFNNNSSYSSITTFGDKESLYDPVYVKRTAVPWENAPTQKIAEALQKMAIDDFLSEVAVVGGSTRFSGVIDGELYTDAGIKGGMPQLMRDKGYDYLDFDMLPSGYPGDLFGFSIALHGNKLVVGSPFTAFSDETVHPWSYYINNQDDIKLSYNGGAGAVYIFEKTFNGSGVRNTTVPWEFTQKLRPNNINVGQDISDTGVSQDYSILGPNPYSDPNYLARNTKITDQFGYDVAIDSDIIVVGAPGHDFDKYVENIYDSGSFIRKAFNDEFDIPERLIIDLGNSGVRDNIGSGTVVLNNGAIFVFENSIDDWIKRSQKWKFIEKMTTQNNRQQSNNENDNFGRSVYVDRSLRSDADYTILGGAENHDIDENNNAGLVYTNDIMLRKSSPALVNPNTYIDVKVFGERSANNEPTVRNITSNNANSQLYYTSGVVYSNKDGAIFLEASGQDPSAKGFIQHRPYIVSIDGLYRYGTQNSGNLPLFVNATVDNSENMNLFMVATTGNVYNNLGLYSSSIVDFGSGNLNFFTNCPDPTTIFDSGLPLIMASGIGLSTDNLNLRIRGH